MGVLAINFHADKYKIMRNMKRLIGVHILCSITMMSIAFNQAMAQNNNYGIVSPDDGAIVNAAKGVQIQFDFRNEPKANHIHLFLDDTQIAMTHKAYGKILAGPLSVGKRKICVGPVNYNHTPVGEKNCITVIAE